MESFEEIAKLSKFKLNKILKEKRKTAAFTYLKNKQSKKEGIKKISYSKLETQEYLLNRDRNPKVSTMSYRARGQILDIKMQKKWKYSDTTCIGCGLNDETGQEILSCDGYVDGKDEIQKIQLLYSIFYLGRPSEMFQLAKVMNKKLKLRDKQIEEMPG